MNLTLLMSSCPLTHPDRCSASVNVAQDRRAMKRQPRGILYCFTPEAMVFTFITELALAAIVFTRHRTTRFGKAVRRPYIG